MKVERVTPPAPTEYHFVCNYREAITIRMALQDAYDVHKQALEREQWLEWADQISKVTR